MAIAKWMQFGAQQATATESTKQVPAPAVSSADAKKFGLENFGNTCYANSVLQALYFCTPFRELLLQSVDHRTTQSIPPPPQHTPPLPSQPVTARPKPQRKHSAAGQLSDAPTANGSSPQHHPLIPSSPPTLVSALRSLFLYISKHPEDKGVVAPRAFIDKLKEINELFRSTMHQDAHEFLNYLLNKVVEEIEDERRQHYGGTPPVEDLSNSIVTLASRPTTLTTTLTSNSGTSPQDATLVHKLFEGVLTSETRCLTCETVSSRDESFLDLSIDIEQNSSVTACLRQFSASEMLCQKNKFFCDSCCDLQEAEKRMKIKKLPNVLALHLKRFKYQEDVQRYIKLAYRVAFPFELKLFNTVDDTDDADRLYELFAIVVHIGNGPHHGHYVSLVKTLGSWLIFDDDIVEPVKEADIPKYFGDSNAGSAYVLYYQAVGIDLAALGLRDHAPPVDKVQQPTTDPQSSPLLPVPAFPPGLSEEGDGSDISDRLIPAVVATPPQPQIPGPENQPGKAPPLRTNGQHLDDPSNSLATPSSTSPVAGGSSTIGGLFHSLRRGPSAKVRTNITEGRKSYTEPSPKLPMTPALSSSEEPPPPVPPPVNGKERQPERKASTWFKFKGAKMRPESGSEHTPSVVSPSVDGQTRNPQSLWQSQTGQQASAQAPREEGGQYPLDSPSIGGGVSLPIPPPFNFGLGTPPDSNHRDRYSGNESPSGGSVSSSFASTSAMHASPTHFEWSTNPYIPPAAPGLSRASQTPSPTGMRFPRQQNKSVTHLVHKVKKSLDAHESETTPLPRRPLSASEGYKSLPSVPPVPRLPHHQSSGSGTAEADEARYMDRRDRDRAAGTSKTRSAVVENNSMKPEADFQHAETGPGFPTGPNHGTSTASSSNSGNGLIRASRKLSLSAPMLGFGRKDKDKPKDRDKGPVQQVGFYAFSMAPRI